MQIIVHTEFKHVNSDPLRKLDHSVCLLPGLQAILLSPNEILAGPCIDAKDEITEHQIQNLLESLVCSLL